MAEHQELGTRIHTFNLREDIIGALITTIPDYLAPQFTIVGEIEPVLSQAEFNHCGQLIILKQGETYLNLHFDPLDGQPSKNILETLIALRVGVPDYLHLLTALDGFHPNLLGIDVLYGRTNQRMARFATTLLGWHYDHAKQLILPEGESPEGEASEIDSYIFATVPEASAKIPWLEKLDRNLTRILRGSGHE